LDLVYVVNVICRISLSDGQVLYVLSNVREVFRIIIIILYCPVLSYAASLCIRVDSVIGHWLLSSARK
jgi:hypothetical protein